MQSVRSQRLNYAIDIGTVNTFVVEFDPPIGVARTPGMPLRIKAANTVTGAATLSVDGSVDPLRHANGSELQNLDIVSAQTFEVLWNDTFWAMTNFNGNGGTVVEEGGDIITNVNNYVVKIPFAYDAGSSNYIVANFSPAITNPVPGDAIEVRLAYPITGPTAINVNGLGWKAVVRGNNTNLQANDAVPGQIMFMIYSYENNWQFSGIIPPPGTSGLGVPVGGLILTLGANAPTGTLKCNGATVGIASYPALWQFAYYSGRMVAEADWVNWPGRYWTSFSGGDWATWFRLPDLRGEFLRFWDDARGVDPGRPLYQQQMDGIAPFTASGAATLVNPLASEYSYVGPGGSLGIWHQGYLGRSTWVSSIGGGGAGEYGYVTGQPGEGLTWSGGNIYSTITGDLTWNVGGTASETRPRNAPIVPCIVY